jgi:hypothetical protein
MQSTLVVDQLVNNHDEISQRVREINEIVKVQSRYNFIIELFHRPIDIKVSHITLINFCEDMA